MTEDDKKLMDALPWIAKKIRQYKEDIEEHLIPIESTEEYADKIIQLRKARRLIYERLDRDGVEYVLTSEEKESGIFQRKIDCAVKLQAEFRGFFSSNDTFEIRLTEPAVLEWQKKLLRQTGKQRVDAAELKKLLKKLYIGEWDSCYENRDYLDGEGWKVILEFADGQKKEIHGYMKCPYNFDKLRKWLYRQTDGSKTAFR